MIKKFDEFVNERLFNGGVKRAHTNDVRKEDMLAFDHFIKKVAWVDMGHPKLLFSKFDCPLQFDNGDDLMSINDIASIIERLNKLDEGISIMGEDELEWLNKNTNKLEYNPKELGRRFGYVECESKENKNSIFFNPGLGDSSISNCVYVIGTPETYWEDERFIRFKQIPIHPFTNLSAHIKTIITTGNALEDKEYTLKFVKEK